MSSAYRKRPESVESVIRVNCTLGFDPYMYFGYVLRCILMFMSDLIIPVLDKIVSLYQENDFETYCQTVAVELRFPSLKFYI